MYRTPAKANPRMKHVPPTVQDSLEDTLESRIKAKRNYSQQFNSLNLIEHRFFSMRNHDDHGKYVPDKTLVHNIKNISKNPDYGKAEAVGSSGRGKKIDLASKRGSISLPQSSTKVGAETGGDSPT